MLLPIVILLRHRNSIVVLISVPVHDGVDQQNVSITTNVFNPGLSTTLHYPSDHLVSLTFFMAPVIISVTMACICCFSSASCAMRVCFQNFSVAFSTGSHGFSDAMSGLLPPLFLVAEAHCGKGLFLAFPWCASSGHSGVAMETCLFSPLSASESVVTQIRFHDGCSVSVYAFMFTGFPHLRFWFCAVG